MSLLSGFLTPYVYEFNYTFGQNDLMKFAEIANKNKYIHKGKIYDDISIKKIINKEVNLYIIEENFYTSNIFSLILSPIFNLIKVLFSLNCSISSLSIFLSITKVFPSLISL